MRSRLHSKRTAPLLVSAAGLALALGAFGGAHVAAQAPQGRGGGAGGRGGAPATAEAGAPIDLTGYWVSVVTEDWRWRMVTAPKGDFASIPLNAEGRRVGDMWDPDKDTADGNACKSYGAPAIMRVPGRLHITWQDPNTLKIETDAGEQTRLFHFIPAEMMDHPDEMKKPQMAPDWQGYSVAEWEVAGGAGGRGRGRGGPPVPPMQRGGDLKVETTGFKAGYLRKNGPPYSASAHLLEYFDRHSEPNGDQWFTVTTIVHDPMYLQTDFITSTHFKKEPDGSKWNAQPCVAK